MFTLKCQGAFGFLIIAADKGRAERGERRFSEKLLMKISYAGGCWGVFAGMMLLEHKISKPLFMALEVGALVIWFLIFKELIALIGPPIPGL